MADLTGLHPADWLPLLIALVAFGWYLTYSAGRLDRLHHRVESTRAALDGQLARRAAAALESAHLLDPATGLLLADAATAALATGEDGSAPVTALEEVENDLTRALSAAFDNPSDVAALRGEPVAAESLDLLGQACLRVRRKRVVRWARLAGHADWPQMVELDDTPPPGLTLI